MMRLCCKAILFNPCHAPLSRDECGRVIGGLVIGVGNIKIGKCELKIVVSLASDSHLILQFCAPSLGTILRTNSVSRRSQIG